MHVYTSIAEQSRNISQAVNKEQQGAGDQGIINTFGSATEASDAEIATAVKKTFELTPAGITRSLALTKICYADSVRSGAFGYDKPYPWENVSIQSAVELRRHLSRRR